MHQYILARDVMNKTWRRGGGGGGGKHGFDDRSRPLHVEALPTIMTLKHDSCKYWNQRRISHGKVSLT